MNEINESSDTLPAPPNDLTILLAEAVAKGEDWKQAASRLGLDLIEAARIVTAPGFGTDVARFIPQQEDVRRFFETNAMRAAERLATDLGSDSWKAAHSAAKEILSQAGFTPVRKILQVRYTVGAEKAKQGAAIIAELLKETGA